MEIYGDKNVELARFTAIDKAGQVHEPGDPRKSTARGRRNIRRIQGKVITFNFPPDELAAIAGQTRKYHSATMRFRNINLSPRMPSNLIIEIDDPASR